MLSAQVNAHLSDENQGLIQHNLLCSDGGASLIYSLLMSCAEIVREYG
jgi:hypothetical protein